MVAKNGLAGYRQTTRAGRFRFAAPKFYSAALRKTSAVPGDVVCNLLGDIRIDIARWKNPAILGQRRMEAK